MGKNQFPGMILAVMKNLNMMIILFLTSLTVYCLYGYVHENSALDFLLEAGAFPMAPWKLPAAAVGLYICLLLLLSVPCTNTVWFLMKTGGEMALAFFISYVLNFSYTGMVLIIIADIMAWFSDRKWRIFFLVVICAGYFLMDYNLISTQYSIMSIETCWGYFRSDIQSGLLGVKNILTSLNMMAFIIYMVVLILEQVSEKERILMLNEKLNKANDELVEANRKLEEYARESEKAAETRERNRLAREIHDTLGHSLTGIITGIDACVMLMEVAPEATREQLKAIADVARQGIKDVRRSVKALRPDALETMDLGSALQQMIQEMRRSTGVDISWQCDTHLKDFNKDEEDIIYRIVQECITNSIRHGKARMIRIHISREYNMLKINIRDNGIGCGDIQKGFGLHHMEERLRMLNGTLQYSGEDGFVVEALIPIRWGTEEEADD